MWRALPLVQRDLDNFSKLGYTDEFIKWQQRMHNPDRRHLLASENITNAGKLGSRIRWHFESNSLYRTLFPETLPTTKETWTNISLHVRRPTSGTGAAHGEGTFDFIGVGSALQSRHYDDLTEDDLVGKKAIESPAIMDKTVDYHRLLVGAFESEDKNHENDELVVGNRWGYTDLNSWIRENEPWFNFSTHSALGGCCDLHPIGLPIFPEEFSAEKLLRYKKRLGSYYFSCQFLNNPAAPEDAEFSVQWLNYYDIALHSAGTMNTKEKIVHDVRDGMVKKDLFYGHLNIAMTVDPNHAGNAAGGRCRHAIVVAGLSSDGDYYLLDYWAKQESYDSLLDNIYKMADKWHLRQFGLESVAAQRYLGYHINYRNRVEGRRLKVIELKGEAESPDGTMTRNKEFRIRALQPIFENRFWCRKQHQDFIAEYETFPKGRFVDILDALAYIPQMLKKPRSYEQSMAWRHLNHTQMRRINMPYSVGVGHA